MKGYFLILHGADGARRSDFNSNEREVAPPYTLVLAGRYDARRESRTHQGDIFDC